MAISIRDSSSVDSLGSTLDDLVRPSQNDDDDDDELLFGLSLFTGMSSPDVGEPLLLVGDLRLLVAVVVVGVTGVLGVPIGDVSINSPISSSTTTFVVVGFVVPPAVDDGDNEESGSGLNRFVEGLVAVVVVVDSRVPPPPR